MKRFACLLISLLLVITLHSGITNSANAEIPEYYLSVNVVGSGVVAANGSSPYTAGDVVKLTAYPSADWEFTGWSGDLGGSVTPEYVVMNSAKVITATFTEIPEYSPTIDSCDSTGVGKDTFGVADDVYVIGNGFSPSTTYDLYLVQDVAVWSDGMVIPTRVFGTATTVSSDANGNVPATLVWGGLLVLGKYDVVVDVNSNGVYDAGVDVLDDGDVEVTAGLNVIPEVPMGTLMASTAIIVGFACYFGFPKIRKKKGSFTP